MDRLRPALCAVVFAPIPMLCFQCAYADDTSAGVMLPGLRSEPAGSVAVSAASLRLQAGRIEATLEVTVRRGQASSVVIRTPRFGWLGEAEPYPDRQFPELQILVGGAPARTESTFAAFAGSADVTAAIRAAGFDPFAIADTPPFVTPGAGDAPAVGTLERLGAVEQSDGNYIAKWTAQRKVKVALSPSSHTLTLKYMARPGFALLRFDQMSSSAYLAKYCLSAHDLVRALGPAAATRMFVVSDYAIPLSIDDRSPPSLSVAVYGPGKEEAQEYLIAFCGADGKAVIGQAADIKALARPDAKGVIRIWSCMPPPSRR
jgi:hypothetical protein